MTMRAVAPFATTSSMPSSSALSISIASRALPQTPLLTLKTPVSFPGRQRRRQRRRATTTITTAAAFNISSDVAALVAFSALPFLGVQALANSDAGKRLKEDLEKRKPSLLKAAAEAERRRGEAAKEETRFYGPQRGRWLPRAVSDSLGEWALAPHLPGEVAGDCGFDPLGLCREKKGEEKGSKATRTTTTKEKEKERKKKQPSPQPLLDAALFDRYFELELLHARWAMLGALGAVVPEALSLAGLASFPEDRWQFVGRARLTGTDLNYFGIDGLVVAGKQGELSLFLFFYFLIRGRGAEKLETEIKKCTLLSVSIPLQILSTGVAIIAGCQLLLMSGPELARSTGIAALEPLGIFLSGQDKNYPGGGAFDPLNFANKPREEVRLRVAEIKHGRLAMVAWLGFAAQALVGGKESRGPLHDFVDLFS